MAFINKLDRTGADPLSAIQQLRDKLGLNAVAMQVRNKTNQKKGKERENRERRKGGVKERGG